MSVLQGRPYACACCWRNPGPPTTPQVLGRGERLEVLVHKTDSLGQQVRLGLAGGAAAASSSSSCPRLAMRAARPVPDRPACPQAFAFKRQARSAARQMWWQNARMGVIIAALVLVGAYALICIICSPTFKC